ncbi:MAG: glycosyltransferase family 9 protein [Pyrinomonadaceae bacterium]
MNVKSFEAARIERVVVRGVNWVGDAVMTIPALRELRLLLPHAHITLATRAWAEGIFAGADYLDALLIDEPNGGVVRSFLGQQRKWRSERFDLALIFPNSFQSAFLAFSARIPHRIGFATDKRGMLLSHPLPLPESLSREHEVYYYLHLIGELERLLTGYEPAVVRRQPSDVISVSPERMGSGARVSAKERRAA